MRETAIAGEIVDFDNFKLYRSDASKSAWLTKIYKAISIG